MTTSPSLARPEIQAELISEALASASVGFLVWDDHRRYVAANAYWDALFFAPPVLPPGMAWHVFANTSMAPPEDIHEVGKEPRLNDGRIMVGPRSLMVLVGR